MQKKTKSTIEKSQKDRQRDSLRQAEIEDYRQEF